MKTKNVILFAVFLLTSFVAFPKTGLTEANSNYVVIGAFSVKKNAIHFAESAKKGHLNAAIEENPVRRLFYVYVLHTGDRTLAIEEAKKLREQSSYNDTWVYSGLLGNEQSQISKDIDPMSGQITKSVVTEQVVENTTPAAVKTEEPVVVETPVVETPAVVEEVDNAPGKNFFFKIIRASTGEVLKGEVDVIDVEKSKKSNTYAGNTNIKVRQVANKSGNFSAECQVFGYRKITHLMNFETPEATDGVTIENGRVLVPFEMVRLRKGDYTVMYNVMFYKDAAVMRAESKYEVDALLDMMKENPKYKIKIHGHTNGKASGKIISRGESKNFFSLTGSKDGFGTAKKLSEERANTIRDYLIAEGISADRLAVKAWGGKKGIYEKTHPQAHTNVRVEIEIVAE